MELAAEPFELRATIYNIKSIITIRIAEKNQHITIQVTGDAPHVVVGDDMHLSQILSSLLSTESRPLRHHFHGHPYGYAATKAIRASDLPNAKNIPILTMTANAFLEHVARCHVSGMNDHIIAKPLGMDLLLKKLSLLIPNSNQ